MDFSGVDLMSTQEPLSSRGIGSFFFFAIPAILGIAASVWLGFRIDLFHFNQEVTQANRSDGRVGVHEPLKEPLKLFIKDSVCVKITYAYIDGRTLTFYVKNECPSKREFIKYNVKPKAPDGTLIHSEGTYLDTFDGNLDAGDRVEETFNIPDDTRIATVEVSTNGGERE